MDSEIWKSLAYSMEHCLAFSKCSQCFFVYFEAWVTQESDMNWVQLAYFIFSSFLCFTMPHQLPNKTLFRCILFVFNNSQYFSLPFQNYLTNLIVLCKICISPLWQKMILLTMVTSQKCWIWEDGCVTNVCCILCIY